MDIFPKVTEDLIRKRSEHNECEIGSLEEISLHQEDIGRIENIQNWCRDLKILLLHSNLIPKIENLGKLKKLEYVNFTLNLIEKIENLEGCESLEKLDLTLNFIGDLTSVESLRDNHKLKTLYLTGNPCTDYEGYRDFVVAALPQLEHLDGEDVLKSERIQAERRFLEIRDEIVRQQERYKVFREKQRLRNKWKLDKWVGNNMIVSKQPMSEEQTKEYWASKSEHCPETRIDLALRSRLSKEANEHSTGETRSKITTPVKLFDKDGNAVNVNRARVQFKFEDKEDRIKLDVAVYKHLDSAFIDVDVHPRHVTVTIKGKILQLTLMEEVSPDQSTAQRSAVTGHLLITMPKVVKTVRYKPNSPKSPGKSSEDTFHIQEQFQLVKAKKDAFTDDFTDVPPLI